MGNQTPVWYVRAENGEASGPFSSRALLKRLRQGGLRPSVICWREGMTGWKPLSGTEPFASAIRPATVAAGGRSEHAKWCTRSDFPRTANAICVYALTILPVFSSFQIGLFPWFLSNLPRRVRFPMSVTSGLSVPLGLALLSLMIIGANRLLNLQRSGVFMLKLGIILRFALGIVAGAVAPGIIIGSLNPTDLEELSAMQWPMALVVALIILGVCGLAMSFFDVCALIWLYRKGDTLPLEGQGGRLRASAITALGLLGATSLAATASIIPIVRAPDLVITHGWQTGDPETAGALDINFKNAGFTALDVELTDGDPFIVIENKDPTHGLYQLHVAGLVGEEWSCLHASTLGPWVIDAKQEFGVRFAIPPTTNDLRIADAYPSCAKQIRIRATCADGNDPKFDTLVDVPVSLQNEWENRQQQFDSYQRARSLGLKEMKADRFPVAVSSFQSATDACAKLSWHEQHRQLRAQSQSELDDAKAAVAEEQDLAVVDQTLQKIGVDLAGVAASLNSAEQLINDGKLEEGQAMLKQVEPLIPEESPEIPPCKWCREKADQLQSAQRLLEGRRTRLKDEHRRVFGQLSAVNFENHFKAAQAAMAAFDYMTAYREGESALSWSEESSLAKALVVEAKTALQYGQLLKYQRGSPVADLLFIDSGRELASACLDGTFETWKVASKSQGSPPIRYAAARSKIVISPDQKWLGTIAQDGVVELWDLRLQAQVEPKVVQHPFPALALDFSPDPEKLVFGDKRPNDVGTAQIWSVANSKKIGTPFPDPQLRSGQKPISAVAFNSKGDLVVVGDTGGNVALWNPEARTHKSLKQSADAERVDGIRFALNGNFASYCTDGPAILWTQMGEQAHPIGEGVTAAAFSPTSKRLFTGHSAGRVQVWDVRTGRLVESLQLRQESITAIVAADDELFATGSSNGMVAVWDLRKRNKEFTSTRIRQEGREGQRKMREDRPEPTRTDRTRRGRRRGQ
ncbi:MAG: GYF domain-containing protein [Planctomycetaceae bacterium]